MCNVLNPTIDIIAEKDLRYKNPLHMIITCLIYKSIGPEPYILMSTKGEIFTIKVYRLDK